MGNRQAVLEEEEVENILVSCSLPFLAPHTF